MAVTAPLLTASALIPGEPDAGWPAPVEYAVAVDRYLSGTALGPASRRVYRISLASWAWPLAGRPLPAGRQRRGARHPVIPLALLDDQEAGSRLAVAIELRSQGADMRTVNRELSALRSAVGWWQDRGWIRHDPTTGLRTPPGQAAQLPALTDGQLAALFGSPASLREQAFWHLLRDTGAAAPAVLGLDAGALGIGGCPGAALAARGMTDVSGRTSDLLAWLLSGRAHGPVFLTDRRAVTCAPQADRCPLTGRGRMSYRRAAEIFTAATRPLDPHGHGWTLHQLRRPPGPRLAS